MADQSSPLADFASSLVDASRNLVDDLEVWITQEYSHLFRIENRTISPRLAGHKVHVGMRALRDGTIGYAAIMRLDPDLGLKALKRALQARKPSELPRFGPCPPSSQRYSADRALLALRKSPGLLYGMARTLRDRTFEAAGANIDSLSGYIALRVKDQAIATGSGQCDFSVAALIAMAEADSIFSEEYWSTSSDFDREVLADLGITAWQAIQRPRVQPDELGCRGQVEVVLHPRLLESLLRTLGSEKFTASAHLAGLSELEEGQEVAHPSLTLVDDATHDAGYLQRPVDDEGTPCRRFVLLEKGRFAGFISNRTSAERLGREPTGHGYRRPLLAEAIQEAPVREKISALDMPPGGTPLADLIGGIDKGLMVYDLLGLHTADQARAAFSCGVLCGLSIEEGRIERVLAPGAWNLSGHLFDLDSQPGFLRDVVLSRERIHTGSANLPYLKTHLSL